MSFCIQGEGVYIQDGLHPGQVCIRGEVCIKRNGGLHPEGPSSGAGSAFRGVGLHPGGLG